mgnify:CR=1 FL=1
MKLSEKNEIQKAIRNAEKLLENRIEIMKLPPEQAVGKILNFPQPAALVHSFPEQDFYFLVQDIGPEDSLSILALASNRQWEYILDMEIWHRDRVAMESATRWLDLLLKADPRRMIRWCLEDKLYFIEYYLFKSLDIVYLEQDGDPSDLDDDFFSVDDAIYVRVKDNLQEPDSESGEIFRQTRRRFLTNFIRFLAEHDFVKYQQVLLEAMHVLPAEAEEKDYRLRNVRLAEKSFLPFEDAVGIYQALTADQVEKMRKRLNREALDPDERKLQKFRTPHMPFELVDDPGTFSQALRKVSFQEIMPLLQTELASLCNQIISADQKVIRNRDQLGKIVSKACGYLNIGLDQLAQRKNNTASEFFASLLHRYPLLWIFKVGYGEALSLKWKTDRWYSESWFNRMGLPLTFWDENRLGVLGGLLLKKPLFFDNYKTGVIYREFASTRDIEKTASVLDEVIAVDQLLSLITLPKFDITSQRLLTYKNLLLTLWARNYIGLTHILAPIEMQDFGPFFDDLFGRETESGSRDCKMTSVEMKTSFLNWLSHQTGLATYEISERAGETLESLFAEIENEYGGVSRSDLDPRFVNLFLLER